MSDSNKYRAVVRDALSNYKSPEMLVEEAFKEALSMITGNCDTRPSYSEAVLRLNYTADKLSESFEEDKKIINVKCRWAINQLKGIYGLIED